MNYLEFGAEGTTGEHPTGVFYRSDIVSPHGARYQLLREKQHTDEDIKRAKNYLRKNFDVTSIKVIKEGYK